MKQETIIKNEVKDIEKQEIINECIMQQDKKRAETLTKKQNFLVVFLIFFALFAYFSIKWIYNNTGNVTLEQLIFHLVVPIEGTNMGMIWDYFCWTFLRIALILIPTSIIIYFFETISARSKKFKKIILYVISISCVIASVTSVFIKVNIKEFIKNQITASTFIEQEYIDPSKTNMTFPEDKQNLIYIYLESIENTFTSIENGGMYEQDRIPELNLIAKENINFSNTEKLGGAYDVIGTNWTVAAMVSQTAGVPLKISIDDNGYDKFATFLPGTYSLGEILEKNGYTNYLLLGSDSAFGGRKLYFEQHGNYKIWDYNSAIKEGKMEEKDKVWWGFSDSDLFKYAKEQLNIISKQNQPFNFTLLTVDTHFTDGYICEKCENIFEDQYSNVIRCSSKQVAEFVNWIKEQPFYENTTIIIAGDHLTMQSSVENEAKTNEYNDRTVYNAFINSKIQPQKPSNRKFFTMDMYPTTLAALGVKIEGNKLGLGTNLFSDEQTLAEKYGIDYVRQELEKKSVFYNKNFIYSKK